VQEKIVTTKAGLQTVKTIPHQFHDTISPDIY